ncbi:MAG: histidine--tRNA ligase [Nanoarchaeota archaeon]|nr:histidine--tRNA ligase [Nanoarchaeota archaeon]
MELQTAKGARDLPPEEKIIKNKVVSTITNVFELYGFAPLETPILERYETLEAKYGAGAGSDVLKETFTLTDQGGRRLGLRFEMTTSLGRYIAQNPSLKLPFKVYQVGNVFRDGPIKLGREREFWQCDADTIGTNSMLAEAEQIALVCDIFRKLQFKFIVKINNRKLLDGILMQAGITTKPKEALIAIDKLEKIGKEGVSQELQALGCDKKQISMVLDLLSSKYNFISLSKKINNPSWNEGRDEVQELFRYLTALKIKKFVNLDLTLVRGQGYYTGTVIEAYLKNNNITSSIAAGGRYNNMIRGLKGEDGLEVPAVGVSFGITPIMEQVKLQTKVQQRTMAKVLIVPLNTISKSLQIAQELRSNGIATDFVLGKKGISKNLEYADAVGIPYVAIIGEKELKKNKILIKEMSSGTEQLLLLKDVVKKLA